MVGGGPAPGWTQRVSVVRGTGPQCPGTETGLEWDGAPPERPGPGERRQETPFIHNL